MEESSIRPLTVALIIGLCLLSFLPLKANASYTISSDRPIFFPCTQTAEINFTTAILPLTFTTLYRSSGYWYFNTTRLSSTVDMTVTAYSTSTWFNATVSGAGTEQFYNSTFHSLPVAVYIDGVSKTLGDGWTYTSDTIIITGATTDFALYFAGATLKDVEYTFILGFTLGMLEVMQRSTTLLNIASTAITGTPIIEGIPITLDSWDFQQAFLDAGDFTGWITAPFVWIFTDLGFNGYSMFWGILTLGVLLTFYLRYRNFAIILILGIIFGGSGGVLALMVPGFGLQIMWVFMVIGLAGILIKLWRGRNG